MEIVSNNYIPGDPRLIDHIVYELKSKGIFDNFRKECIADVDTKPAYQNLRQRVEGSVSGFLKTQRWRPDMNKNQVREMLRKNISESGFLETGVERIVDQVVNPKINSIFLPHVEDVVYKYLGVQKPSAFDDLKAESIFKPIEKIEKEDIINLLPSDLEAVSPESEPPERKMDISNDSQKMDDSKIDDDESPPFEPLEELLPLTAQEDNSIDSHVSGFSGLASHDSNNSYEVSNKIAPMEISNQDTQFSKQSSDDHLSIVMSDDVDSKMEINEDSSNSKFSKTTDTNSKNFDFSQESLADSDQPAQNVIKQDKIDSSKKHEEKSKSSDKKSDKHRSSEKYKSRHDSRSESKEHRSDKDRKSDRDKKDHRDRSKHNSKDGKDKDREKKDRSGKDEKDSKNKSEKEHKYDKDKNKGSSNNSSSNRHSSSSSKDKNKKESSDDKAKEIKKESSEQKDSKVKESDYKSLKPKDSSSSSTSHKDSKTKERNDSSKSRDGSKSRSEPKSHSSGKSKSDSRSHSKHNGKGDAERSSSKSGSRKDEKSSRKDDKHQSRSDKYSSSKKDDKDKKDSKKDDKKGNKDDHYGLKSKSSNRRSTDRDSSDGHSGTHSSSSSFADSSTSFQLKSSQGSTSRINSHSNSGDSGNSDKMEQVVTLAEVSLPSSITISESRNEDIIQSTTVQSLPNPVKLIKPKFASNIFEARRLMKIRKKLGKIEKQSQMGLIDTGATLSNPVNTLSSSIIDGSAIETVVTYEIMTTQENEPDNNDNSRRRPNILKKTFSNKNFKKKSNNYLKEVGNETKENKTAEIIEVSDDDDPVSIQLKNFSKESWDAIEAKHLQNITYNSYVDTSYEDYEIRENLDFSENQKVDEVKSEDCLYLTSDSLQNENYFNVVNTLISCLNETIANKENLLRNSHVDIDRHRFNKKLVEETDAIEKRLPKAAIMDVANDNEIIISPIKITKNNASRTHRILHNNNNKRNHQVMDDDLDDHMNHTVTEINNSLKSSTPTKTKKAKLSDSTANHVDDFNLPLSPAESENSLIIPADNKKSEKDDLKIKQNSNINKAANNSCNQRYSTDDLYKPRLRLRSSRRRAAKNQDQDVN